MRYLQEWKMRSKQTDDDTSCRSQQGFLLVKRQRMLIPRLSWLAGRTSRLESSFEASTPQGFGVVALQQLLGSAEGAPPPPPSICRWPRICRLAAPRQRGPPWLRCCCPPSLAFFFDRDKPQRRLPTTPHSRSYRVFYFLARARQPRPSFPLREAQGGGHRAALGNQVGGNTPPRPPPDPSDPPRAPLLLGLQNLHSTPPPVGPFRDARTRLVMRR